MKKGGIRKKIFQALAKLKASKGWDRMDRRQYSRWEQVGNCKIDTRKKPETKKGNQQCKPGGA